MVPRGNRWKGQIQGERMERLKVRCKGKTEYLILTHDKIYDVIKIEKGWYRIVDDSGEDYLYPPRLFEIVDDNVKAS